MQEIPNNARYMYMYTQESLAAAMFAVQIFKKLMEVLKSDRELAMSLSANAEYFEKLAMGVLSQCYMADSLAAEYLLIRKVI